MKNFCTLAAAAASFVAASTAVAGIEDYYVAGVGTGFVNFSTGETNPFDSYISALTTGGLVNGGDSSLFDPTAGAVSNFVVTASLIDSDPTDDLFQIGWSLRTTNSGSFYDALNPITLNPLPSGTTPNAMFILFGDPFGFTGVPNAGIETGSEFEFVEGEATRTFLDGTTSTGATNYIVPGGADWFSIRAFDFGEGQTLQGFEVVNTFRAIPTPGALALLGIAGVAGGRRRR